MSPRRLLAPLAAIAFAIPAESALAQRDDWDSTAEGADACRPIWREFGRSSNGRARAVYCEVREIGVAAAGRIEVDGEMHGGVRITGGQRSDIRVRLVIQTQGDDVGDAKEIASRVRFDLSRRPWRPEVPEIRDNRRSGRRFASATVVIDAPSRSDVIARAEHGPLSIAGITGRIDASGEHGPVHLEDVGGDVRARVAHGPLSIDVSGARWDGAGLDAEATHGPLTLRLPRDFQADLELGAEHGPFNVDFPVTVTRFDRRRITTKLGAGGPPIRAFASHGPLSVRVAR